MQTDSRNTFTSIHTEGSQLPVDLLQRVLAGNKDLGGLTSADYHLPGREKLNEAINRSWNRMQGTSIQTSKSRLKEGQDVDGQAARGVITIEQERKESNSVVAPKEPTRPAMKAQEEEISVQTSFSDFGCISESPAGRW
jgi:hypothetical protein